MKRRLRWKRVLILVLALAALLGGFLAFRHFRQPPEPDQPEPTAVPSASPTSAPQSLQIDLMDYSLYEPEDLDFSFALVRFRFRDEKALDYPLSRLSTDENINLADVSNYVKRLEEKSYYLGRENVVFSVKSSEQETLVRLFVPYRRSGGSLTITDSETGQEFTLDLSREAEEISALKYSTGGEVKADDYVFFISDAYISNMMTRDGESYATPETIRVYTFRIEARQVPAAGAVITAADFVPDGSDDSFEALDGSYASARKGEASVIGRTLLEGESGALFFEIYNPEEEGITYEGKILITLAGHSGTIEVSTTLH